MNAGGRLRLAPLWWGVGGLLALAITIGSLMPVTPPAGGAHSDKLAHFAGYWALSFWFVGMLERRRYPVLAAALLGFGLLMELGQYLMGLGRQADWRDVVANSLGVGAALLLAYAGLGAWLVWVERRLGLS
jgi:VanZ family protein